MQLEIICRYPAKTSVSTLNGHITTELINADSAECVDLQGPTVFLRSAWGRSRVVWPPKGGVLDISAAEVAL